MILVRILQFFRHVFARVLKIQTSNKFRTKNSPIMFCSFLNEKQTSAFEGLLNINKMRKLLIYFFIILLKQQLLKNI